MPSLTLAFQTRGRSATLQRVTAAALATDADEVLVLVNGCRDGSAGLLAPLARRAGRLRVVARDEPLATGPARAELVRLAQGEVVLLTDDDVLAGPGLAAAHRAAHADRDDRVVQGYMPVDERARVANAPAELYSRWYEAQVPAWEADGANVLRGLWGGNISVRREVGLAVSPAHPAFTAAANQDREWGLRLLRAGLTGRFVRSARATHLYRRSVPEFIRYQAATGAGHWQVHALHGDLIGPMRGDHYVAHLPPAQRRLVRLARRPRSGPLLAAAAAVATVAGRLPAPHHVRREALVVAITMAQQRAALEASRRG